MPIGLDTKVAYPTLPHQIKRPSTGTNSSSQPVQVPTGLSISISMNITMGLLGTNSSSEFIQRPSQCFGPLRRTSFPSTKSFNRPDTVYSDVWVGRRRGRCGDFGTNHPQDIRFYNLSMFSQDTKRASSIQKNMLKKSTSTQEEELHVIMFIVPQFRMPSTSQSLWDLHFRNKMIKAVAWRCHQTMAAFGQIAALVSWQWINGSTFSEIFAVAMSSWKGK